MRKIFVIWGLVVATMSVSLSTQAIASSGYSAMITTTDSGAVFVSGLHLYAWANMGTNLPICWKGSKSTIKFAEIKELVFLEPRKDYYGAHLYDGCEGTPIEINFINGDHDQVLMQTTINGRNRYSSGNTGVEFMGRAKYGKWSVDSLHIVRVVFTGIHDDGAEDRDNE